MYLTIQGLVLRVTDYNDSDALKKILEEKLVGYKEYKSKVKFRLVPFVW